MDATIWPLSYTPPNSYLLAAGFQDFSYLRPSLNWFSLLELQLRLSNLTVGLRSSQAQRVERAN